MNLGIYIQIDHGILNELILSSVPGLKVQFTKLIFYLKRHLPSPERVKLSLVAF